MDRQYIREHQVIERYLKRELTADEEKDFEETYLGDPDLLDEIELVERLRDGLKELKASGGVAPRRGAWFRTLATPQYAAAASMLLAASLVVSGALYVQNLALRQGQNLVANGGITRIVPLVGIRGGSEIVVEAPDASELAVLLVDPGFTRHDSYRAVVSRRSNETLTEIWAADGLAADFQDQIAISMPSRLLTPGDYEIAIAGRMKDWPAGRGPEPVEQVAVKIVPRAAPR
jgi:hypothetical protein